MRKFNIIVIAVFGFSLLLSLGLDLASDDYEFIPKESPTEGHQPISPEEEISQFVQVAGDPGKDGISGEAIFLNPLFNRENENILVFQLMIDLYNGINIDKIIDLITLEDSKGRVISKELEWQEDENSTASHIMGILVAHDLEGDDSLLQKDVDWIKLTIADINSSSPLEFKWVLHRD